jgi:glycosyltransferase involved in cell wall biosynthesis
MTDSVTKVAIVGIQGLPPKYGGYETLVDFLSEYTPENISLTVYCSSKYYPEKISNYKFAELVYIGLPSNGIWSFFYDSYCIFISRKKYDSILMLGCSGGLILPFLQKFRYKFILNIGGVEWKRSKYNRFMQLVVRILMKISVKYSGKLIADNIGIKEYISHEYQREDAEVVEYGGDQVHINRDISSQVTRYPFLKKDYILALGRIQSDNNVEMLLDAFSKTNEVFVYIGNWGVSTYAIELRKKYQSFSNLIMLDAIYDLQVLDIIRSNCTFYMHAHSAGGTNPSLVEAMHYQIPILCYDNGFNNNTTKHKAIYFKTKEEILQLIVKLRQEPEIAKKIADDQYQIAKEIYTWKSIATKYFNLIIQ